jgi:excisionase family DNA binding protein
MPTIEKPAIVARGLGYLDAAAYLGICRGSLRTLVEVGEIVPVRLRGRVLFLREDLDAMLERNRVSKGETDVETS